MNDHQLRDGLWRWTAAHPEWAPGKSWPQHVGSVAWQAPAGGPLVLIDPIVPAADAPFWAWLAAARGGVVIVHGNRYHGRSTPAIVDRTGARVWQAGEPPPAGGEPIAIDGLDDGETAWYLAGPRALVLADAVLGAGGGELRVAPETWADDAQAYRTRFRASLRALVGERAIDLALTSHGEPALAGGRDALLTALERPAWRAAA